MLKEVEICGIHLKNKNIALIVMNSVEAYKAYNLILELRKYSCEVFPYVSQDSLNTISKDTLEWISGNVINDENSNHQFDAVVIYPMTSKFDDNLVKDLIFSEIIGFVENLENVNSATNFKVEIISNQEIDAVKIVRELSESNLKGKKILVTSGPTPVKIDSVRRITNKFSGKLGIEIAKELYLRGADVTLLQSYGGIRPPIYLNQVLFQDYEEYKDLCLRQCSLYEYGIFSAAVADYKPKIVVEGKIPSGGVLNNIELVQTEKVINLIREKNPNLKMISFKYEEGKTLDNLLNIAEKRLKLGHMRVVTNDLTLNGEKQKCFLCGMNKDGKAQIIASTEGKVNIARMIADDLENQ
jgi:phosphopantothenoylcysteine decarboxylase/phosphopantothenate--cysteine ligase